MRIGKYHLVTLFICIAIFTGCAKQGSPTRQNTADYTQNTINSINGLKLSAELTEEEVLANWGPPDAIVGSGFEYLVYELKDGRRLWLLFDSYYEHQPLLRVRLFVDAEDREGKFIFDRLSKTLH